MKFQAVTIFLTLAMLASSCGEGITAHTDELQALSEKQWVQSMTDEIKAALEDNKSSGDGLAVCLDTSGSISNLDLILFIQYINNNFGKNSDGGEKRIYLIIGDTEVDWEGPYEGEKTFTPGSAAWTAVQILGSGGTDFRGLIEAGVDADPAVILYLTDGFGILPEEVPDVPIIWVLNRSCWTGPDGYIYDPNCEDLAKFGEITSMHDEAPKEQS